MHEIMIFAFININIGLRTNGIIRKKIFSLLEQLSPESVIVPYYSTVTTAENYHY